MGGPVVQIDAPEERFARELPAGALHHREDCAAAAGSAARYGPRVRVAASCRAMGCPHDFVRPSVAVDGRVRDDRADRRGVVEDNVAIEGLAEEVVAPMGTSVLVGNRSVQIGPRSSRSVTSIQ